jgi:hypothetical protein
MTIILHQDTAPLVGNNLVSRTGTAANLELIPVAALVTILFALVLIQWDSHQNSRPGPRVLDFLQFSCVLCRKDMEWMHNGKTVSLCPHVWCSELPINFDEIYCNLLGNLISARAYQIACRLGPHEHWGRGFESHSYGCMSAFFCVVLSLRWTDPPSK